MLFLIDIKFNFIGILLFFSNIERYYGFIFHKNIHENKFTIKILLLPAQFWPSVNPNKIKIIPNIIAKKTISYLVEYSLQSGAVTQSIDSFEYIGCENINWNNSKKNNC